jgi:hypothetical protein
MGKVIENFVRGSLGIAKAGDVGAGKEIRRSGAPAPGPSFGYTEVEMKIGAGKEIRTPDPRLGKAMLYH